MNDEKKYCLYFHINSIKNEVFYVGIGSIKRPYEKRGHNNFWVSTVKKYGYYVDIIETGLTWDEACKEEIHYINKIGRRDLGKGNLVNLTDGGEGAVGWRATKEQRLKLSVSMTGQVKNEQTKVRMKDAQLKRFSETPISDVTKIKMRKNNLGQKANDSTKSKMSLANKGKPKSESHKLKMKARWDKWREAKLNNTLNQ